MVSKLKRVSLALPIEEYDFLENFCKDTHQKPATVLRRLYIAAMNKELLTRLGGGFFMN